MRSGSGAQLRALLVDRPRVHVEPPSTEDPDQPSLFDVVSAESHEEYTLPDRNILRRFIVSIHLFCGSGRC